MNSSTASAPTDIYVLRNAMLFSLTRHAWSNRVKANSALVETTGDKKKLHITKRLLVSKELEAVETELNRVYQWALDRSMSAAGRRSKGDDDSGPRVGGMRKGIYFVKRSQIANFEAELARAQAVLSNELVPAFLASYDACREAMRKPAPDGLGDLFNETEYPSKDVLEASFSIEWSWLALSVPDELPAEVREREIAKLRESFEAAQEEIKLALREGFKEMLAHAVDRLKVEPGQQPKKFRDSLVTNFKDFFETFDAKNLMDDAELAAVVAQAKRVVDGLPPKVDTLRSNDGVRASTADAFAQLNTQLTELVESMPARKLRV